MAGNALQVEHWPVGRLLPSARNPRVHGEEQILQLCASIREFGFCNPVLVDPEGEIIAGEARWRAAERLGLGELPVIVLGYLTPRQRDAYRIADNRLALNASWNDELLGQVLRELHGAGVALPVLGFSAKELDALLEPPPAAPAGRKGKDEAAPPPAAPVTRPGDLWHLGDHRLVCGDSTDANVVGRVMAGGAAKVAVLDPPGNEPADLIFTDPPYGMAYGGGRKRSDGTVKHWGMILGDDAQGADLTRLVHGALANAVNFAKPESAIYVCLTWRTYGEFATAIRACGLVPASCIVWNKGSIGLGLAAHYRPQHEFILYCRGKAWFGGKAESDVWTISRGAVGEYVHPTQKPVELIERAVRNSSRAGDVVLDVFGGSGSTLIACETLGRKARLVELDPKYCDAIVQRWQDFTGRAALLAGDGRPFEEVAGERRSLAA
jgi:DNA modification methylase